ncbi:MOSC domain-containing protein [Aestuariivita sp.]|uniref:MOSC domain-containing protein n=1 Tax=Aestuariivita sp. TaxID=1872407 RepID=UPI002171FA7B|nr:MOSC domain-containing protein [Aestuariivita sp.]MCE8005895.1 MOSC domain-containing protein [Aestuariivita sp.]
MPVLVGGGCQGEVVWLGRVPAEAALRSEPLDQLEMGFHRIDGERHMGENRASCSRVRNLYPVGTEIRNVRQLSILSQEELDTISSRIGLEQLDPSLLGATVVLRGIPDFTHVPPSSRLQAASGLTLTVDMENRPCVLPGREIEADTPGHGAAFKAAAKDRRGVTAWVERPGTLRLGDMLTLFVPDQRAWQP